MSFADNPTSTLLIVRENLLRGLDVIADHLDAGTFDVQPKPGACPPSQAGQLTLTLLNGIDAELARRNGDSP
jgi:hypothetical protein